MPNGNVEALEDEEDDESDEDELILGPPSTRSPPGRPKKKRVRRESPERVKKTYFCSRCKQAGTTHVPYSIHPRHSTIAKRSQLPHILPFNAGPVVQSTAVFSSQKSSHLS